MLLARSAARRKEIAIRLALGGSRADPAAIARRRFRPCAGRRFFGLLLGLWSSDLLVASLGINCRSTWYGVSGPSVSVLIATFVFCLLGTLAFALGPALKLSKSTVIGDLKGNAGEDVVRRGKFLPRNPLVVVQIAFSLALLTAAALFIRGAGKAAAVDTGLQTRYQLPARSRCESRDLRSGRARSICIEHSRKSSRLCPGSSGPAFPPRSRSDWSHSTNRSNAAERIRRRIQSRRRRRKASHLTRAITVWERIISNCRPAALRGRPFNAAEAMHQTSLAVAIIDEVLAKKFWPNGTHSVSRFNLRKRTPSRRAGTAAARAASGRRGAAKAQIEIVGIVPYTRADLFEKDPMARSISRLRAASRATSSFTSNSRPTPARDTAATTDLIRQTVREVDAAIPISSLKTFAQHLDGNIDSGSCAQARRCSAPSGLGSGPRCRSALRREGLLGRAADPGDRHSHGARRPAPGRCNG